MNIIPPTRNLREQLYVTVWIPKKPRTYSVATAVVDVGSGMRIDVVKYASIYTHKLLTQDQVCLQTHYPPQDYRQGNHITTYFG